MLNVYVENENKDIIIYGAHLVAQECFRYLEHGGNKERIRGFAVSDMADNPDSLFGIPVREIGEYESICDEVIVIIATPEKFHNTIEKYIMERGFMTSYKLSLEEMSELKGIVLKESLNSDEDSEYILLEDDLDKSWLNIVPRSECGEKVWKHYKFPTLYYEDWSFLEAAFKKFSIKDAEKCTGKYHNLHSIINADDNCAMDIPSDDKTMRIYMAFGEGEVKTVETMTYDPWIFPIQVGSDVSDLRYGNLFDDADDNISKYNKTFAEMTAAYWIWKNSGKTAKYKGLCHYRRHFVISKAEIETMDEDGVDVVLPIPRFAPGGMVNMFIAETPVKAPVVDKMIMSVKEIYPDEVEAFTGYLKEEMYYPNNMVIARSAIYDAYCEWIFPVLFRMRDLDMETGYGHGNDRHIAYAAELLTSFFFVKHKDDYRIAVTDYRMLTGVLL